MTAADSTAAVFAFTWDDCTPGTLYASEPPYVDLPLFTPDHTVIACIGMVFIVGQVLEVFRRGRR